MRCDRLACSDGRGIASPVRRRKSCPRRWQQRLGWISVAVFLEINDVTVAAASNYDVYALVMAVAQGELALDDIAEMLRHRVD